MCLTLLQPRVKQSGAPVFKQPVVPPGLLIHFNHCVCVCMYVCMYVLRVTATFIALRSIVLVEILGIQKLTDAFGLTVLFQGVAVLLGSPLSGLFSRRRLISLARCTFCAFLSRTPDCFH